MKIDKKDIEYIASLSRIELSDLEKSVFVHQLNNILSYIEKLNELNTENVKQMAHPMNASNVFREDRLEPSISSSNALLNAPAVKGVFFKVPKVIE